MGEQQLVGGAAGVASKFWDERAKDHQRQTARLWLAHPAVQRRMNRLVSGDPALGPFEWFVRWFKERHGNTPVDLAVSLGAGTGGLERGLSQSNIAQRFLGLDASPVSVAAARSEAAANGFGHLSYEVFDLNTRSLAEFPCGLIFSQMAAHHVENLELLFAGAREALQRESGYFVLNEFIGPARFQWTPTQVALIKRLLRALPPELRSLPDGQTVSDFRRPFINEMVTLDPSESVRSHELLTFFEREFEILEYRPWRGGLLHNLLSDIIPNFIGHPLVEGYVDLLAEVEDILTEAKMLDEDFAAVIGRPRS